MTTELLRDNICPNALRVIEPALDDIMQESPTDPLIQRHVLDGVIDAINTAIDNHPSSLASAAYLAQVLKEQALAYMEQSSYAIADELRGISHALAFTPKR